MRLFGRSIPLLGRGALRKDRKPSFFFCVPLKPKRRCASWDRTVQLFGETLRSLLNQSDTDFFVLIAGHDRPDVPEMEDPRVTFYRVDFPEPTTGGQGKRDQNRKMHFLGAVAREHGGGYFMVVDGDDLVHKDVVKYVRSHDNRAAYMVRAGYVLDTASGKLGKFNGNNPRQFFHHCGTSSVIYLRPEDLPERSKDGMNLKSGDSFLESVFGHGIWESKLLEREIYADTLPFRACVYRLNTGDNASYTYRRDQATIDRIVSCVVDNQVSISILEQDFGVAVPESWKLGLKEEVGGRVNESGAAAPVKSKAPNAPKKAPKTASKPESTSQQASKDPSQGETKYAGKFYSERRARTLHSAQEILKIVMKAFPVESVVDVGCGTGTWLDVAHSLGVKRTKGFEGHWLDLSQRDAEHLIIQKVDLEQPIREDEQFDLAISLEVAEHLSEDRARSFVDDLCRLSKVVLFGAAIPGQGGRGHVNEQWQTYWARLFAQNGYIPLDLVRPKIWSDSAIKYWYRQNTLVFCEKSMAGMCEVEPSLPSLDVVHPDMLLRKRKQFRQKIKDMRSGPRARAS